MAKHNLHIEFANEKGTYAINVGSTFNDEFGEKLDSASVIISKIDRKLNIKPNDEVYIFDKNNINEFDRYYLVDSVYCKEITLNHKKQYQYTIELKSLTGYLDLVQLPNRTINHSLVKGQKFIIDYIEQFVEIYAPKIKKKIDNKWKYSPLFEVGDECIEKFSVPCMDLSFSQPTLRQALTSLMLQVSCLPKIVKSKSTGNNYLSFLDLKEKPKTFTDIDKSQNYTTYSYASDSYVNTLVNMNDNVLDDDNVVITETIGFRDTNNVLLKQTENLFLNTTYPIYSVERLAIKIPVQFEVDYKIKNPFKDDVAVNNENGNIIFDTATSDFYSTHTNIVFSNDTQVYVYDRIIDDTTPVSTNWSSIFVEKRNLDNYSINANNNILVYNSEQKANRFYVLVGSVSFVYHETEDVVYTNQPMLITSEGSLFEDATFGKYYTLQEVDITPLCVEQSKRQLLNTNFYDMIGAETIEDVSKFIYGTVGYNIGDTKIEGFSSTYNFSVAWWQETRTYMENIIDIVKRQVPDEVDLDKINKKALGGLPDGVVSGASNFEYWISSIIQFTRYTFSLTYKPLNTFRLNNVKEEEQFYRIEQLDTKENAISNFNDVAIVEQQKVNRLGNEVVVKNQRTEYLSAINEINTKFDDYIVFSRTIAVGFEDYKVNYTASKNYVLQNYFTAIQTKYRAYEYISYGQSVVRKENTTIYAKIGKDYYDGDDYIYFGNKANANNEHLEHLFLSGATNLYDEKYKYKCAGNGDTFGISLYKTDLSILISENIIAFNTQTFDSVSYGVALVDSLVINNAEYLKNQLGGAPQKWYPKGESEFESLTLAILRNDGIFLEDIVAGYSVDFSSAYAKGYVLPYMETPTLDNAMYLVDNNKSEYLRAQGKTYYLDQQEVLNQTIQFTFYTDDKDIKWTEKLWKLCNFVSNEPKGEVFIYKGFEDDNFDVNKESYTTLDVSKLIKNNGEAQLTNNSLLIKWTEIDSFVDFVKFIYKEDNKYYDLLAVRRLGNSASENIYITLNDTRTDKVAYIKNGLISFNEYVVAKNTLNREVVKV